VEYDLTVVYNSNTLHAYNFAGGKSLYAPNFNNRATVVSFQRSMPMANLAFFQWLGHQNYRVNYIAESDLDDYTQIQNSRALMITGHSEYWTREARANVDKYADSGKNVLMLSGNNMWWQVRYDKTKSKMICYKSNSGNVGDYNSLDPLSGTIYSTINYGDNVDYGLTSSLGTDYRWGGYGQLLANRWNGYKIVKANSPVLKGSGLNNGDIMPMPTTEYEGAPVVKLFDQSSTEIPVTMDWCLNFGDTACTQVRQITKNMIDLSLSGQTAFTS
jgi:hypothetical protein